MNILIVGSGVAGLTLATALRQAGDQVNITIVERERHHGGLAKSFTYHGEHTFDIGPKRFHTDDPDVLDFLTDPRRNAPLDSIDRSSKVHFLDRFFTWPLRPGDILKLPPNIALQAFRDLIRKSEISGDPSGFEFFIRRKYGSTLFELFFKPYTEKFLHIPIEEVHGDWAHTGINRSIVNKEHRGSSLLDLLRGILMPQSVDANFLYPRSGGFGGFWDSCARALANDPHVTLKTSTSVQHLEERGNNVFAVLTDGTQMLVDTVCWSGRLPDLLTALGLPPERQPRLDYIDTVFCDIVVREADLQNKDAVCQWLYISSGSSIVSRVSFPREFHRSNIPEGYEGLCVEVTIPERTDMPSAEALRMAVQQELERIGLMRKGTQPVLANIRRQLSTYPVYRRAYRDSVAAAQQFIARRSSRIITLGRSGSFWYNNSDHSIKQALVLANDILAGRPPSFDPYEWFGGNGS